MLGLPGDTKEAHIRSIETVMNAGIDRIYVHPMVLLPGSEAERPESRRSFGLKTKFRILSRCYGTYRFGNSEFTWGEAAEHVVATDAMSFDEYLYCKRFQLTVEIFYNDTYFEEFIGFLRHLNIPVFAFVDACHLMLKHAPKSLQSLYDERDAHTLGELFDTEEECMKCVQDVHCFSQYRRNEHTGSLANQKARAVLYHTEAIHVTATEAMKHCLVESGLDATEAVDYVDQLARFSLLRKNKIANIESSFRSSFDYAFRDILNQGFAVEPADFRVQDRITYLFSHDVAQAEEIRSIVNETKDPIQRMRALVFPNSQNSINGFFRKPQRVGVAAST